MAPAATYMTYVPSYLHVYKKEADSYRFITDDWIMFESLSELRGIITRAAETDEYIMKITGVISNHNKGQTVSVDLSQVDDVAYLYPFCTLNVDVFIP